MGTQRRAQAIAVGLLLLGMALMGCAADPGSLAWTSLIEQTGPSPYQARSPSLLVVRGEQGSLLEGHIRPDDLQRLTSIALFDRWLVVIFHGERPTAGYGMAVEAVQRTGDTITVVAHWLTPTPEQASIPVLTSPYLIAQVPIPPDMAHQEVTFLLQVEGEVVARWQVAPAPVARADSGQGYPAPPSPPTSEPAPYPGPLLLTPTPPPSPSPLPSPTRTPYPTIPPDLPLGERARLFVAQRFDRPLTALLLADESVQHFPLTDQKLWQGVVLDSRAHEPLLFDVLIDARTGTILESGSAQPYWDAEQAAYLDTYGSQLLDQFAQQQGISRSDLEIDQLGRITPFPLTGRVGWSIHARSRSTSRVYQLGADETGNLVELDVLASSEAVARQAKYGKLDRELYYLLRATPPQEPISVILWVSGLDEAAVNAELAQRFPQLPAYRFGSGQPLDESGSPIEVDPALFDEIRRTYNELLDVAILELSAPVVDWLAARGYEAEAFDLLPEVAATLPAEAIQELNQADLPMLTSISWGGIQLEPQLDSVEGTLRVTSFWEAGLRGQGVAVGGRAVSKSNSSLRPTKNYP